MLGENVDAAFRLLLEDKEQALLALQETVEVRLLKKNLYNTVAPFLFQFIMKIHKLNSPVYFHLLWGTELSAW